MNSYNIIIVDDHTLFRKGISMALTGLDMINQIREAANGLELMELLEKFRPDIILMDINMPLMDGVEATRTALARFPELKIIALSMLYDKEHYQMMISAGVKGFLSKDASIDDVINAIHTVGEGSNYFSPDLLYDLVVQLNENKNKSDLLTEREREILSLIASGLSNQEIADSLFLSKRTVDKHRENILSKTRAKNTADLIMFAIKNKLV